MTAEKKTGKTAFVCDTEYQVFNALNYMWYHKDLKADLYLGLFFSRAGNLAAGMSNHHFFDRIVLTRPHFRKETEGKIHWYLRHATAYLLPKRTLKRDTVNREPVFFDYQQIFTSSLNCYAVCLISVNQQADVCFLDDGAGSYFSYDKQQSTSKLHRFFSKIFHAGAEGIVPDRVYLYSTRNARKHAKAEVLPLPKPTEDFLENVRELFGISVSEGINDSWIWLTHPDALTISTEQIDHGVKETLTRYQQKIIVRKHPRDDREELYRGFRIDESQGLWEIQIPFYDMEKTVLIGTYSTAQMTPKLLYDMEPRVIILCRLYKSVYKEGLFEKIVQASLEFRDLYRDKTRVMIPENFEELGALLQQLS